MSSVVQDVVYRTEKHCCTIWKETTAYLHSLHTTRRCFASMSRRQKSDQDRKPWWLRLCRGVSSPHPKGQGTSTNVHSTPGWCWYTVLPWVPPGKKWWEIFSWRPMTSTLMVAGEHLLSEKSSLGIGDMRNTSALECGILIAGVFVTGGFFLPCVRFFRPIFINGIWTLLWSDMWQNGVIGWDFERK